MIRWCLFLAMLAGVVGFAILVLANGFGEIEGGVAMVGFGLVALVVVRLIALSLAGLAWSRLRGGMPARPAVLYVGLRIVREAINCMLPVAQVGGDLIGARLLARTGVPGGLAGASILLDLLLQVATQAIFAFLGLAALWWAFGDTESVHNLGVALAFAMPALVGFLLAQRIGVFALVDRAARLWPGLTGTGRLDLQPALDLLHRDRRSLLTAAALHLVGWSVGVIEIWIVLTKMGLHPSSAECLVIESLGQAARSAGFVVPAAIGIQEGGFVLLGALFGLSPPTAIALSIAKRLPDFAIGLPGLAAWQVLEMPRAAQESST
ncbi:MAG TPA: lysylphosphatidylglycerol synthase domain-containing protein [Stellaceae bacterium]|nr:lysylphosphatidylglycerol synthase domain-containing protein [Stellaceae bacterium]